MIRSIVVASLGLALMATSAEAAVYCNEEGLPQGCVWSWSPGVGAPGVGVVPGVGAGAPGVGVERGVGVGARGVGVAPDAGVGRFGDDGAMNRGGPVNRAGRR